MLNIFSYNKFSRELSQTPWLIDGERKSESSVEEHICQPLSEFVLASEWRFSASGREDVDVRMLGTGRPFVVEFINPRRVRFTGEQMTAAQVCVLIEFCSHVNRTFNFVVSPALPPLSSPRGGIVTVAQVCDFIEFCSHVHRTFSFVMSPALPPLSSPPRGGIVTVAQVALR